MTGWLTTGQMIDKLKFGEVAKGSYEGFVCYVRKSRIGAFYVVDDETTMKRREKFALTAGVAELKWSILPNYVSFEEAMKALKEGKTITSYLDDSLKYYSTYKPGIEGSYIINWKEIEKGKWTIEE